MISWADRLTNLLLDAMDMTGDEADNTTWRATGTRYGQRVVSHVLAACDHWDFKFGAAALTLTGDGTTTITSGRVLAPTDFLKFGPRGVLAYGTLQRDPLEWTESPYMFDLRTRERATSSTPERYCVANFDTTTDEPYIYVYPFPTAAVSLQAFYEKKWPTLVDADTSSGMEFFPDEIAELIQLGTEERLRKKIGSLAFDYSDDFKRMLAQQIQQRKQGQERIQRFGEYGVRLWQMH
jgi:hypothetical protein